MPALSFEEFNRLMAPFGIERGAHIAVGVSGGADSLCLSLFLGRWAKENHCRITALTVNHNLRQEAAAEADAVHHFLLKQGINHQTLVNETPIPQTGLESYARQIRYFLLTDYCRKEKISHLFLAHHQNDQAETFFLRLSKSSGLKGLSGMRAQTLLNDIILCRPFLTVPKEKLTAALQAKGVDWVEDKMNADERFERVKWRKFLPELQKMGLKGSAVVEAMARLERADCALDEYADSFIQKEVWIDFRGFARLPFEKWQRRPQEERLRIIEKLIRTVAQSQDYISLQSLESLCAALPESKTLGGCVFKAHKTGLYIFREARRMAQKQPLKKGVLTRWDRFLILPDFDGFVQAGAPLKKLPTMPKCVQNVFPAVFVQKELENFIQIDYKEKNDLHVQIEFLGKSKGSDI